jgi:putative addiction module antidote
MVLKLRIRKVGNSLAVILPKAALAHLNAKEGDTLVVTGASNGALRLAPRQKEVTRQIKVGMNIMKRYRRTLKALAKP